MAANPEESGFPCEDCGEVFESRTELNEHIKEVHESTPEDTTEESGDNQEKEDSRANDPEELDNVDYRGHAPEDVEDSAEEDEVNLKGGDYKTTDSDKTEEKSISEKWEENDEGGESEKE